ncbi:MAG: class I SAM-dependent methyltransferase [Candidatus Lokiarchaeota archaeon]|nr:class I SAM-dependent methyltransferase [Candidatus Lokiarchaeota archaeon]
MFGIVHWGAVAAIAFLALALWQTPWGLILFYLLLYFVFFVAVIVRILRHVYHFPIPSFLTQLIDNPIRRRFWQNPDVIAERMQLAPGMVVVEIGPGKGSYTSAVARRILPDGIVYAVDISENVIQRLKARFEKEGVKNVIPQIEDAYHFSFAEGSVDRVFAVSCLPEIPDHERALAECRRILKPNGLVSLSELAVDPDYPLRRTEKKWAEKAGLEIKQEFGNWVAYQLNLCKKASR